MTVNGGQKEDVYATLLLTETYLPGAMVLAHSLIDAGTTKKLAVLVVDGISEAAITELKTVYSYVIPVPKIVNSQPANLALMNRADLHSAFTKINLWKLTQFRKIVYVDADIVAYVAPDELFDLAAPFSAAPDIGWPDLFNTGLMALTPNEGDYNALLALAQAGVSFDGADQGLINTYYGNNYNRLSFTYNVTPSAHYQYIPAYRHFQADIKLVHFIGSEKPWFVGRGGYSTNSPFTEMTSRWWATYDRHYKVSGNDGGSKSSNLVRSLTKGEFRYTTSWDAQRQSPPTGSNPEAPNFPTQVYAMSSNAAPFVTGYSSAPPLRQIFPWEANQPKATRVFYGEGPEVTHQPVTKKTPDVPSQEVLEEQPSGPRGTAAKVSEATK